MMLCLGACAKVQLASPGVGSGPHPPGMGLLPGDRARADAALVVYNVNARDAAEIANYYRNARGVPDTQICPVTLPPGLYATSAQLLSARRQILERCLCPLLPDDARPRPCRESDAGVIARLSPITHLVLIRGVPARLTDTGWPSDGERPSFDYYLSASLYRPASALFGAGTNGQLALSYIDSHSPAKALFGLVPGLDADRDRMLAYGRIEALDRARTLALIDRTLAAEDLGVSANVVLAPGTSTADAALATYLADLTGTASDCAQNGKTAKCRLTIATDGVMPASASMSQPILAGMYLGTNALANRSAGFDGSFSSLLGWHTTKGACVELCSAMKGSAQDQCRKRSTDVFQEINTACVGTAPGFLGSQAAPGSVAYYGLYPPGWSPESGAESTPPVWAHAGGYQDARFTDVNYLHFGEDDAVTTPECETADGGRISCTEQIAMQMHRQLGLLASPALTTGSYRLRFSLRYRNAGGGTGALPLTLTFLDSSGKTLASQDASLALSVGHTDWTRWDVDAIVPAGAVPRSVGIALHSTLADNITGWMDLDGLELVDGRGTELLDASAGGFNEPMIDNLASGDYAANAIDRLGAVAWWGNSSRHLGTGSSFDDTLNLTGAFFSGRTLGEALLLAGNGMSGIVYGDPLYAPAASKISLDSESAEIYRPYGGTDTAGYAAYAFSRSDRASYEHQLLVNVMQGRNHSAQTMWRLERCAGGSSPAACDSGNGWKTVESGRGAGTGQAIELGSLLDLVDDLAQAESIFLRLGVWSPGDQSATLFSYAYLSYSP